MKKSSLVEFRKAVSGPHGQNYPDALKGQAMIGRTRTAAALVPTGRHVSHANDLVAVRRKRRTTAGATSLGHFGKGLISDTGADAFRAAVGAKTPAFKRGFRVAGAVDRNRGKVGAAAGIATGFTAGKTLFNGSPKKTAGSQH